MASRTMQFRPFLIGAEYEDKWFILRINIKWWLQRIPMFLFAFVSSYGVGHLLKLSGLPAPFYQLGGISFDIGFLGVIALADMQLTRDRKSTIAYYALNITMSVLAALFNVLSHAGGKYADITAENVTAGAPFAIVGLLFALYYHSVMAVYIEQETIETKKEEDKAAQTKEKCKYCGEGKPSMNAVYGHYRSCVQKKIHDISVGNGCTCNVCTVKI